MPSTSTPTTPTPTLSADELLKIAKNPGNTLSELQTIGEDCFRPYAEAIEKGTHEKNYVKNLPGRQGFTDVFASLNAKGLTTGVNSLDGKHHIFQHCHYVACYRTEKIEMPQEQSVNTPTQVRELFASAMQPGEQLKVRAGSAGTVVYNDSSVGKPQDRVTPELFNQIERAVRQDAGERVEVPLTKNQKPKRPEIEVVAVSAEGERTLFRQEKGLGISTNILGDLAAQLRTDTQPVAIETETVEDTQPVAIETETVEDTQPVNVAPAPNTVEALRKSVEKLPPSKTKALWQKISADVSILNAQIRSISKTSQELKGAVTAVPKAIQQDTKALIQQGRQRLENIRNKVETQIKQTSIDEIASMAIKGTGIAVEAGSKGLGLASTYLSDRAEHVKSYGMAKAALAIYNKGQSRTGESIFKAEGYTVEAVTEGYTVKDLKDRLVMSFATDAQGKPMSITKSPALQPADYKAVNQASKSAIIKGSEQGEQAYTKRLQNIAQDIRDILPEGTEINGSKNFHVKRPSYQALAISTHGFPQRQLKIDDGGNITNSNLTLEDMNRLESSVEQSPKQALEQPTDEPEKVKVGVEIG